MKVHLLSTAAITTITALTLSLSGVCGTQTAQAAESHSLTHSTTSPHILPMNASRDASFDRAVALLDPYVKYGKDSITLNAPESVRSQINPALLHDLEAGLANINQQIREGKFSTELVETSRFAFRKVGKDQVILNWWGYDIFISNDTYKKLEKVGFGGGGAAVVIGSIPGAAPIIGTIGGVIGGATAVLSTCNWHERGIHIKAWILPPPRVTCSSQ